MAIHAGTLQYMHKIVLERTGTCWYVLVRLSATFHDCSAGFAPRFCCALSPAESAVLQDSAMTQIHAQTGLFIPMAPLVAESAMKLFLAVGAGSAAAS